MKNGLRRQENTRKTWLFGAFLLAAMSLLLVLNTKITVYSDDYWYGTFFDDGVKGFVLRMIEHYLSTNGRFYVHLIVPTVLLFDTKLYIFLSPVFLALLFWAAERALNEKTDKTHALLAAALGILCTLALDVQYLRMSLLWISAYFNYIFPVCMTALAAWYQGKYYRGELSRGGVVAGAVFCVLAGASTEQCGIMSLVVIWGFAAVSLLFGEVKFKKAWLYPALTLLGFLTILLAPGSWARVDRGVGGGILSFLHPTVFLSRFYDAMIYVIKYPSSVALLSLADIMSALVCVQDKKLPRVLLLGFVFAPLQILCAVFGFSWAGCVLAAVGLLYQAVCFALCKGWRMTGLWLLASFAAQMTLVITSLGSERTAVAGIVALICVAVSLLLRVVGKGPAWARRTAIAALAALCVLCYIPTLQGYTESKKIVDANLASVEESRQTGICEINIDIDPRYRFTMLFEGSYFYNYFRDYYDMDAGTKIEFVSEKWDTAQIGTQEETYEFPTLSDGNTLYFPVDYAVSAAGGQAEWSWKNKCYTISLDGVSYLVTEQGEVYRYLADGSRKYLGDGMQILLPFSETYTLLYTPAEKLTEFFKLQWHYDAPNGRYIVEEEAG